MMDKLTSEQIRNAMFGSLEDYQEAVVDSLEFDLERKLTTEEISAVYKRVDDVVTAGFKSV